MARTLLNVDVNPHVLRKFKLICVREGETMSEKVRKWIVDYINEHEKGNPQIRLDNLEMKNSSSLLEQVLEKQASDNITPALSERKRKLGVIRDNLELHPKNPVEIAKALMKEWGCKAETMEQYMREAGKPIKLTPMKRRRSY